MKPLVLSVLVFLSVLPAGADTAPYAGQDTREIKALSPERFEGLRDGAGVGYTLAAELNGWPGPLHALELADDLDLSPSQREQVEAIRATMLAEAKTLGEALIVAEAVLDTLFAEGEPSAEAVMKVTADIGRIEARLRAVHLSAHLKTTPVLTRHQRMIYARARGYGTGGHSHGQGHGGGQH